MYRQKEVRTVLQRHLETMAYEFLVVSGAFCILFGLGSEVGCRCVRAVGARDFGYMLRTLSISHVYLNTLFLS